MTSNRNKFISHLLQKYPSLAPQQTEELVAETMISDYQIELPASVLNTIQKTVSAFHQLRLNSQYQSFMQPEAQKRKIQDCGHHSIMMSYDFHLNENLQPKLIEINTNAAFHVLGLEMYQALGLKQPWSSFDFLGYKEMIEAEILSAGITLKSNSKKILITDESPEQQRLYLEFLAYQELFKSYGWQCEIIDTKKISETTEADFIYNRNTDFYFETEQTVGLRNLSFNKKSCVSPHPYEYMMLADKERMTLWNQDSFLEQIGLDRNDIELIRAATPRSFPLSPSNSDQVWAQRKGLFFKPMRAFGSKQSYKGSSVSRKVFDELISQDILAQEYLNAPTIKKETPTGMQEFKYDLRCYTYKDQLQSVVARIYQGQVTNLKTTHGGFAPVIFRA